MSKRRRLRAEKNVFGSRAEYLNRQLCMSGIFFTAAALLILYILSIRWHIYLPISLFWVAIALMLGTVIYQILKIESSRFYVKVVLLEIAFVNFAFHMIYQIPHYGLYGYDIYFDMASTKGILFSGHIFGDLQYVNVGSYFPIIHILGAVLSLITNIDLFSVAKWFPSLLDTLLIFFLYLLVKNVFKEEKIALLSVLLFASLQNHIMFGSLFIRETAALVFVVICLYLYFSAEDSTKPSTYRVLSIVFLIGTIFAHHLTSFALMIFLLIHLLVIRILKALSLHSSYFGNAITGKKVSTAFFSIAFVTLFSYWIYVITSPFYTLITFVRNVFTPAQWGIETYADIAGISISYPTIRGYIIFYGFYFFQFIFGLILLFGLWPRTKKHHLEKYSFALYLFSLGLVGLLSIYLVSPAAFPDRYLTLGWLLGFAPLVTAILSYGKKSLKKVGVFLLFAFMLFNIYMGEPASWDPNTELSTYATEKEDYALASAINFSVGKICGNTNPLKAIYDVHNNLGTVIRSSEVNLEDFRWIIIQRKRIELERKYYLQPRTETIAMLERLATEGYPGYNKVYESKNLLVFEKQD